jgi:hypothetical protein
VLDFGRFRLASVDTGRVWLDGGAMFGVVPRPLWAKELPPDEDNRVELALRALLVVDDDRRILVDTGIGDKFDPQTRERLRITQP